MLRLLPGAYVVAVAAVAIVRLIAGVPTVHAVGLTPDRLASGKLWLLVTSAFVANGPALPQIAALAVTTPVFERALSARAFALLAPLAHVGATLLTYATLAAFTGDPDGSRNAGFDYGISAIWLGMLGALFVAYLPAARRGVSAAITVVALCAAAGLAGVSFFPLLASCEHGFAFALGALAGLRLAVQTA